MTSQLLFSEPYPMLDGEQVFLHYEHVRSTLPDAGFGERALSAAGLLEIASHYHVFVFDAYGVLNVGGTSIASSPPVVQALRAMGKQVLVLSNGASFTAATSVEKFIGFGYDFTEDEIVSSRMAAERALSETKSGFTWGAMAKLDYSPDEFAQSTVKLAADGCNLDAVDGFLLLSTLDWDEERQVMLERSFERNPRPVMVANPDIVSPRENHFGVEPGYIAHRLNLKFGAEAKFHGKPFGSVFDIVAERLEPGFPGSRICMIGDTLHTDILGAAARGWHTALVTDHGMFKGLDAQAYVARSGIVPNWIMPTI